MPAPPVHVQAPAPPAPELEPAPAPPKPRSVPRRVEKKARPVAKRVPKPVPKRAQKFVPDAVTAPASVPAPAPPMPEPPASTAVVAAPAPVPAAPPPDIGSLVAQYRAAIIAQAKRYRRYPRFARDNGWQGKVDVRMAIGADGAIASLRVARSTGYAILDQQALEMVRSARPQAPIPDALRGKAFGIDVPVIFSLRDADN